VHDPSSGPDLTECRLRSPGFRTLLVVRVLTVLNDNIARWFVIGVGKRAAALAGTAPAAVLTIGTVVYVLPFMLLAWLAGWLADRFAKRTVVGWSKFAEIGIAGVVTAVVAGGVIAGPTLGGLPGGLWLLLLAVGLFGAQTAILNPSLIGTIPETVPKPRLSAANGLFALVSLAATLAGMAVGNWLADATPLAAALEPVVRPVWLERIPGAYVLPVGVVLGGVAIIGWLAAVRLPRIAAADPQAPPPGGILARTGADLAAIARAPKLAGAVAGIVYFWALAAVAQLNVDQYGFESGATTQGQIVPLLVALVGGIGLGSVIAGRWSRHGIDPGSKVDLGFVPLGAAVMSIALAALALSGTGIFSAESATEARLFESGFGGAGFWLPMFWLTVLGAGAGMFDVPLEAYLQEQSPPERRGSVLASTNLLVFAGMLLASFAYYGMRVPMGPPEAARPLVSARGLFAIFAILSAGATAIAVYAAPRASLRMFVATIVNTVWRFRVRHEERLPEQGPAVLVANHLSWLDGFLLPLCAPRQVRMVVYGPNIQGRFLNMLADQWRFILFDPKPKSIGRALKAIQEGLAAGDVIGIFCEGGISRHGQILGFKRGLEWLLSRVDSPLVPVHLDGLWGSLLSFSEGRFFTKRPRLFFGGGIAGFRRPITLTFGWPLPVGTHPNEARLALQELSAEAVRQRLAGTGPRAGTAGMDSAAARAAAEAFDGACLVRRTDRLLASLAPADPLFDTLGTHGPALLGIPGRVVPAGSDIGEIASLLAAENTTIWLARVEQVEALTDLLAADVADRLAIPDPARQRSAGTLTAGTLTAVVMPIAAASELPRAESAAAAMQTACGIQPVVAFAPARAGGLVAMNTPPARAGIPHEATCKAGTLGRVLTGAVVWPSARDRIRLGLPSLALQGIPDDAAETLVIGAMLPCPPLPNAGGSLPGAALLTERFTIDDDGFVVP
jgi:acyl-[acyl-carrier-protein]-phospholipid O-acyltransferase/long-chain-fatty-acid--[acyl-carrier-protein] ligase